MKVLIHNTSGHYDGREVPYIELEVLGDRHTLSVRKYPKNTSIQMWKNSNKQDTRVSMKLPNDKFFFYTHVSDMINNFETEMDNDTMATIEKKWHIVTKETNF